MVQKGLLDFFAANYLSQRRPRVSQSVSANRQLGTQRQFFFLISLEFSFVTKFNARFIEIISHFKGDIRSCRCNNSSNKQVSGLIGGSGAPGPSPLDPPLYALHALQCSQYVSIHYTAQQVKRPISLLNSFSYTRLY